MCAGGQAKCHSDLLDIIVGWGDAWFLRQHTLFLSMFGWILHSNAQTPLFQCIPLHKKEYSPFYKGTF